MRMIRTRDKRSFYRKVMDFIFGEKLTDEERKERERQMLVAHCHMLGAGGGATGKVEIVSMKEERRKEEEARKKAENDDMTEAEE